MKQNGLNKEKAIQAWNKAFKEKKKMTNEIEQEKIIKDLVLYGSGVGRANFETGEIRHAPLKETMRVDSNNDNLKRWAEVQLYFSIAMFLLIIVLCWIHGSLAIVFCAIFGTVSTVGAVDYLRNDAPRRRAGK